MNATTIPDTNTEYDNPLLWIALYLQANQQISQSHGIQRLVSEEHHCVA